MESLKQALEAARKDAAARVPAEEAASLRARVTDLQEKLSIKTRDVESALAEQDEYARAIGEMLRSQWAQNAGHRKLGVQDATVGVFLPTQ